MLLMFLPHSQLRVKSMADHPAPDDEKQIRQKKNPPKNMFQLSDSALRLSCKQRITSLSHLSPALVWRETGQK